MCPYVCVNAERGRRPASGAKVQIDCYFGRRFRAGGGGWRDPVWVTPAAFILTAPHTHTSQRMKRVRAARRCARMRNAAGGMRPALSGTEKSNRFEFRAAG